MKLLCKVFIVLISLALFTSLIGCGGGGGGGGVVTATGDAHSILGNVSMPSNQSATATANIRLAPLYSGLQARLLNSSGSDIVPAATVSVSGDYMFSGVPTGNNYRIVIVSPSNKALLVKILDSVTGDQTGVNVDSNTTAISTLVLSSDLAITAAQVQAAVNKGDVNLSILVNVVENWLCGMLTTTTTDVLTIVQHEVGQSTIDQMVLKASPTTPNLGDTENDTTVPIYTVAQEFFPIQKGNKWVYDVTVTENSVATNTEYSFEILDHTWLKQGETMIADKTSWLASSSVTLYGASNEFLIFLDQTSNSIKMRDLIFLPGDDREISSSRGIALFTDTLLPGTMSFSRISSTQIKMTYSGLSSTTTTSGSTYEMRRTSQYTFTKGIGITYFHDSYRFKESLFSTTMSISGSIKSKTLN